MSERMNIEEVLERTGMNRQMLERAIANRFLPPSEEDGSWLRKDVEALMMGLGTSAELALEGRDDGLSTCYRVTVKVDVLARNRREAEREALKAIVSDVVQWGRGIIEVRTDVEQVG